MQKKRENYIGWDSYFMGVAGVKIDFGHKSVENVI